MINAQHAHIYRIHTLHFIFGEIFFLKILSIQPLAWVTLLGYKPYHYAVVEAPYPSKAACTSRWSTYKVFEPLHMQLTGIWNHRQPVTIALVDPDFDSRQKAWVTLLGYKPYHNAVVEAPYPSNAACTSMWSTYKVFEPLHIQCMGIRNHWQPVTIALVDPDFDSRLKASWVTAGLQTIPLCSGWGSIPIQSCLHINMEHM